FWDKATPKAPEIGAEALGRMLIAYPQTKTHCSHWAYLSPDSAQVTMHGANIMASGILTTFLKFNVFLVIYELTRFLHIYLFIQILAHNIILCMAMFFQEDFTPEVHR
uniref:Globin domain-containing protein n=1 Tax=Neolamprologus brichardi TaxID=32507 RepID=A0A3Q4H9S8_NEOBR